MLLTVLKKCFAKAVINERWPKLANPYPSCYYLLTNDPADTGEEWGRKLGFPRE